MTGFMAKGEDVLLLLVLVVAIVKPWILVVVSLPLPARNFRALW